MNQKKKRLIFFQIMVVAVVALFLLTGGKSSSSESTSYVRAATYFGNEWPINFWNSEMDHLKEDMAQIKRDGFDSIVLVIPWREFQPELEPVRYNEEAFRRLNEVLNAADDAGLGVYTRIAYMYDYQGDDDVRLRLLSLLERMDTRNALLSYARELHRELCIHENFRGAFVSWEDFWFIYHLIDIGGYEERIRLAEDMGYSKWIRDHYSLEDYNGRFGTNYHSFSEIPLPRREQPEVELLYPFVDYYLMTLLGELQLAFPGLSMEVRLDEEPIAGTDGSQRWYSHSDTYSCGNAEYTAAIYGIPLGFENKGESVSVPEAIEKLGYFLGRLRSANGGKPVFVEQFLFTDNSPGLLQAAQLREGEHGMYLEAAADVLLHYIEGYGIWTYRDYRGNLIYNPGFALGNRGWETLGEKVTFFKRGTSRVCRLGAGCMLKQHVPESRRDYGKDVYHVSFDVICCAPQTSCRITFGNQSQEISIRKPGEVVVEFPNSPTLDVAIEVLDGEMEIDNVRAYSYILEGRLYDVENRELDCIESIRKLNKKLASSAGRQP